MCYIVMTNCKDPYAAKPFTLMNSDDNDVYNDKINADRLMQELNDVEGEGYARVIAL